MMKNVILFIVLIFACSQCLNGQWYYNSCGASDVTNTTLEEFDCLWEKSNKIVKVGRTTCLVGTAFILAGGITMFAADPCCSSGYYMIGGFTVFGGFIIDLFGLPIWITGGARKNKLLENNHFNNQALNTFTLLPSLQINQFSKTYSYGFALTLHF